MVSCRALVVDGDWRIRKLIRSNLEAYGLEIGEAGDGRGCFQALVGCSYGLVLLSAELPDANGWNVVRQLRREAAGPELPIVVIVAEPADQRLLQRFGRVSQLLKPFSALTLLECVDRALNPDGTRAAS